MTNVRRRRYVVRDIDDLKYAQSRQWDFAFDFFF